MDNVISQSVVEFSLTRINEEETVEQNKVMVTSGIEIEDGGCLIIEGSVRIV